MTTYRFTTDSPLTMTLHPRCPVLIVLAACLALSGCHHGIKANACNKRPPAYASAQSVEPIKVPAGIDRPDTHAALRIPELNEPAPPRRTVHDPCLDAPPSFTVPKPPRTPPAA